MSVIDYIATMYKSIKMKITMTSYLPVVILVAKYIGRAVNRRVSEVLYIIYSCNTVVLVHCMTCLHSTLGIKYTHQAMHLCLHYNRLILCHNFTKF